MDSIGLVTMPKQQDLNRKKLSRISWLVDRVCGLYSRVGDRLKRDRSYVSRVARGVRRSDEVERALVAEFDKIERNLPRP